MKMRSYENKSCNLDALADAIDRWFRRKFAAVEMARHETEGSWYIAARTTEWCRKVAGADREFTVIIEGEPDRFSVRVSPKSLVKNIAKASVWTLVAGGASALVFGTLAVWTKKIERDLWHFIDHYVCFGE